MSIKSALATKQFILPTTEDWEHLSLSRYEALLAEIRECAVAGAKILQQRAAALVKKEYCIVCKAELPTRVEHGRAIYNPVYVQSKLNLKTGVYERESICSQNCYQKAQWGGMFRPSILTPREDHGHST